MLQGAYPRSAHLQEISREDMVTIADLWLKAFEDVKLEPVEGNAEQRLERYFNIPACSPNFVGREEYIAELVRHSQESLEAPIQPAVISGCAGLGKSELVIKLAWMRRAHYANCLYVNGQSMETDLKKCMSDLGLVDLEKFEPEGLYRTLKQRGRTLLIVDEAASYDQIQACLPPDRQGFTRGDFDIYITSRNQTNWPGCRLMVIDPDSPILKRDAVVYLQREIACSEAEGHAIAAALQNHPLALSQAAAYMKANPACTVERYLALVASETTILLSHLSQETREETHKRAVMTTWNISLQALTVQSPVALIALEISTLLFPDAIQVDLFRFLGNTESHLSTLLAYSFINMVDRTTFKIHRLLQEVARSRLQPAQIQNLLQRWVQANGSQMQYQRHDIKDLVAVEKHVNAIREHMRRYTIHDNALEGTPYINLLYQVAMLCLDHLYENEKAFQLLALARAMKRHIAVEENLNQKIERQYAKACIRLKKISEAETVLGELLKHRDQYPVEFVIKLKLDWYLLLKEANKLDDAERLLTEIEGECGDNADLKSRCHSYHGSLCFIRVLGLRKLVETIKAERNQLPSWQTDNIARKNASIDNYLQMAESHVSEAILHFQEAYRLQESTSNYREIVRAVIKFSEFVDKNEINAHAEKVIKQIWNLFQNILPKLDINLHHQQYYDATLALAKFYFNYTPVFEALGIKDAAKAILNTEKPRIAARYGESSPQYRTLLAQMGSTQASLMSLWTRRPPPVIPPGPAARGPSPSQ